MKFLIASGEVIEAGPDIVLSADAYRSAVDVVRRHIQSRGPSTVTDLKTALASNRRVTVPLLERLDRDGITRRQGDVRVLRLSFGGPCGEDRGRAALPSDVPPVPSSAGLCAVGYTAGEGTGGTFTPGRSLDRGFQSLRSPVLLVRPMPRPTMNAPRGGTPCEPYRTL